MKVAVLYSGGFDSTYLVGRIQQEYSEVHLLTHIVPLSLFNRQALINAGVLRQKYPGKIRHEFIDAKGTIDELRGNILNVCSDNARFGF